MCIMWNMAMIDIPVDFVSPELPDHRVVKKLSQRHHELARMLAGGVKPGQAAVILHYDVSRVSILQNDPAFKALLSFYSLQRDALFIDTHKNLAVLGNTAIAELQDRLEEVPEDFSANQLIELIKTAADRSGHGPTSTQRNINVTVTPDELTAIKERAIATQRGSVELISQQQAPPIVGSSAEPLQLEGEVTETQEGDTEEGSALSGDSEQGDRSGSEEELAAP
jgi:hypothetical protein